MNIGTAFHEWVLNGTLNFYWRLTPTDQKIMRNMAINIGKPILSLFDAPNGELWDIDPIDSSAWEFLRILEAMAARGMGLNPVDDEIEGMRLFLN